MGPIFREELPGGRNQFPGMQQGHILPHAQQRARVRKRLDGGSEQGRVRGRSLRIKVPTPSEVRAFRWSHTWQQRSSMVLWTTTLGTTIFPWITTMVPSGTTHQYFLSCVSIGLSGVCCRFCAALCQRSLYRRPLDPSPKSRNPSTTPPTQPSTQFSVIKQKATFFKRED